MNMHKEAMAFVKPVADELTDGCPDDAQTDALSAAWAPWFYEVAWDHSYLTDFTPAELTVLCATTRTYCR